MSLDSLLRTRGGMKARVTILSKKNKDVIDQGDPVKIDAHRKNIEHFMQKIESLDALILDKYDTQKEVEDEIGSIAAYHQTILESIETLRRSTSTPVHLGGTPRRSIRNYQRSIFRLSEDIKWNGRVSGISSIKVSI